MLSEEEKAKIKEEENYRMKQRGLGCFNVIAIVFVAFLFLALLMIIF